MYHFVIIIDLIFNKGDNMMKKYTYRLLLLLFVFMTINLNAQPFSPPLPEPGTATIDGDPGEWDLINDFFADMREAGDFVTPKTLLSKVYLRYDCPTETLSILVLTEPGFTIVNSAADNWVKEYSLGGNNKIVDVNGTFSYISDVANPPNIIGYEASGTIAPVPIQSLKFTHKSMVTMAVQGLLQQEKDHTYR
ncbi:MAG: hypothetical protein H6613_18830 [Ignavibacteriales bacterium]|nr:hypothetical protein [Ignavibacteriales bacterium]